MGHWVLLRLLQRPVDCGWRTMVHISRIAIRYHGLWDRLSGLIHDLIAPDGRNAPDATGRASGRGIRHARRHSLG